MNVGILSFEYPPETGFGGIGTYSANHAGALRDLGHTPHVVAGWTEPRALACESRDQLHIWRGQTEIRPARVRRIFDRLRLHWSRNRIETALSMLAALGEVHRRHRLDIVEMPECGGEGLLVNHLLRIPAIVRFHSPARLIMRHYDTPRADRALCAGLERLAMAGAAGFTSCSHFLADEVRSKVGRKGWAIDTIHNGIDLQAFDRGDGAAIDLRADLGLPRHAPVILFSGRLEPRKGVHLIAPVLIPVLRQSGAVAVIAGADYFGHGPDLLVPQFAAAGLRDRVRIPGRLSPAAIRDALRQADVLFMPSQWEACPYACLEAMAAGKPIVAAAVGGVPELLTDGADGCLVPPGDVDAYVAALLRLLAEPALAERIGRAARATVAARFDHIGTARRTLEVYRRHL